MPESALTDYLNYFLAQKGISIAAVARDSLLDHKYIYQIFDGTRKPSRDKLIALCFGLHLTKKEAQQLLKYSGNRELYAKDMRDAILLYSLEHSMTISQTNDILYQHHYELLGSSQI